MILSLLAAAAFLAQATPEAAPAATPAAVTAAQPAPAPDGKTKPKPAKEALVCTYDATLGTRLPQKRCRTKASIAEERAESRQDLNRVQLMTPVEQTSH